MNMNQKNIQDGIRIEAEETDSVSQFGTSNIFSSENQILENTITENENGIHIYSVSIQKKKEENIEEDVIHVYHNNIYANTSYGLINEAPSVAIYAVSNWWGDPSGPYHPETNPEGQGDPVSEWVEFTDWLTTAFSVSVTAGVDAAGASGTLVTVDFTVRNITDESQSFDVTITDSLGWDLNPSNFELTLNGHSDSTVTVEVTIPQTPEQRTNVIILTATSQSDPSIWDSDRLTVMVEDFGTRGDVNGDDNINVLDVVVIINHILGVQPLSEEMIWLADCNADDSINVLDALGIVNVILGIGECEP